MVTQHNGRKNSWRGTNPLAATPNEERKLKRSVEGIQTITERRFSMKRIAIVLATVTALGLGGLTSSAYAYGPGYGYYAGYALDHYRDYIPVATYDGYVPASYGEFATTTYHDAPAYLGYLYRTVIHPGYAGGPRVIHHRHW
jgi:hypothetical protein